LESENPFPDTRWTLIRRARTAAPALDEWCRGYWRPVRDYIRAAGHSDHEADELTQEFFHHLLRRGADRILPESLAGAFRAYLKRSVKNFLTDQWRARQRQRRGGGATHVPLDEQLDGASASAPDIAFARAWLVTVLDRALSALRDEMVAAGKADFFEAASGLLDGRRSEADRSQLAATLGLSDGAFRVALHRLRQRFRQLVEEELRQTVSGREELDEEIRYLLSIWS
jgi:RNA polymerase sigma-70 factor (ECF subfamily)